MVHTLWLGEYQVKLSITYSRIKLNLLDVDQLKVRRFVAKNLYNEEPTTSCSVALTWKKPKDSSLLEYKIVVLQKSSKVIVKNLENVPKTTEEAKIDGLKYEQQYLIELIPCYESRNEASFPAKISITTPQSKLEIVIKSRVKIKISSRHLFCRSEQNNLLQMLL